MNPEHEKEEVLFYNPERPKEFVDEAYSQLHNEMRTWSQVEKSAINEYLQIFELAWVNRDIISVMVAFANMQLDSRFSEVIFRKSPGVSKFEELAPVLVNEITAAIKRLERDHSYMVKNLLLEQPEDVDYFLNKNLIHITPTAADNLISALKLSFKGERFYRGDELAYAKAPLKFLHEKGITSESVPELVRDHLNYYKEIIAVKQVCSILYKYGLLYTLKLKV